MSAYFLVSLPADTCKTQASSSTNPTTAEPALSSPFAAHRHWEAGQTWKSALNNLRLALLGLRCRLYQALQVFK